MEVVTANGELRTVSDPAQLRAVAGCFGLAGIVTAVTLRLDAMTYARFHPKKIRMADSIPRPGADPESPEFRRMVDLCTNHYYAEFFWFPNHGEEEGYWENCWNNDGVKEEAVDINLAADDLTSMRTSAGKPSRRASSMRASTSTPSRQCHRRELLQASPRGERHRG